MTKRGGRNHSSKKSGKRNGGKTSASVIAKKKRSKDHDQVHDDLKKPEKFQPGILPVDEDLPGLGQHYCIACDRYFESDQAKGIHEKSKLHKRRLKQVQDTPHTQRDAEMAAGMTHE
mmetsp:Transcript_23496/g.54796  ORF Transcript_23496/g.54796 Transcript_23496/m.54796 type:complete len:117 (+) Transcript_23496:86-436(+)